MKSLRGRLRDPWFLLSTVLAIGLVLLVIVPQYRIFVASSEQALGKTVFRRAGDGSLEHVPSSTSGFEVVSDADGAVISRNGQAFLTVIPLSSQQVVLRASAGGGITVEPVDDKQIKVAGSGFDLVITQETFRQSFFGPVVVPDPLTVLEDGEDQIVLGHAENAYLTFADQKPTHGVGNFRAFLTRSRYVNAIRNSLIVAVGATAIATVLAVSLAYFFARYNFPGKQGMVTLITMASISPPFLGGYAWRMLLGSQGVFTRLLDLDFTIVGIHGVIWVINWLIFPLIFLMTYDSFTAIDNTLIESSMSLGADKRKTLFKVIIPLAMPGIITGVYLGLMTAFSDFGTPYVISLNLNVLPVLVYQEFMSEVVPTLPWPVPGVWL